MSHQKCFGSIRFGFRKAMQYVFRIAILGSLCVRHSVVAGAVSPRNSANPHYTLVRHLFMRQCNKAETYFRWQSIDAQPESARCVRQHLRPALQRRHFLLRCLLALAGRLWAAAAALATSEADRLHSVTFNSWTEITGFARVQSSSSSTERILREEKKSSHQCESESSPVSRAFPTKHVNCCPLFCTCNQRKVRRERWNDRPGAPVRHENFDSISK